MRLEYRAPPPWRMGDSLFPRKTFMPIKFRCAYCSQLMAIGRRKIGSVVVCPTCQGQVIVPAGEPSPAPSPSPSPKPQKQIKPNVFERQDFDPAMFNPQAPPGRPAAPLPPALMTAPAGDLQARPMMLPATEMQDATLIARPSRKRLILLILGALLLTALGFAAGFATAQLM